MLIFFLESIEGTSWQTAFDVFGSVTVRSIGAAFTALIISWILGPLVIDWLRSVRFRQYYTDKAEAAGGMVRVVDKKGTPTMGGVLIVLSLDIAALIWAEWNSLVLLTVLSLVVLAFLGFYDDYLKVTRQDNAGAKSKIKLVVQLVLALGICLYLLNDPEYKFLVRDLWPPFFDETLWSGVVWLSLPVAVLAIVGSSNSVNLTDGLDGLAIGCTIIVTTVFLVLTYVTGRSDLATDLGIPYVPGADELTVFCAAMLGASAGFLWYNCHPAQVFMGDTGSLALGGAMGIMAVLIHQPFLLLLVGGVFVVEAFSVILQVCWYKYHMKFHGVDRRLFRRAPLHHHFEKMGWHESKVVIRFYILCGICAGLALLTLRIR